MIMSFPQKKKKLSCLKHMLNKLYNLCFVWLQMREEKRNEMNSSKEMRKKRKRNQFSYVCMFGHRERRGKKREKNAFLFPLFGLP